MARATQNRKTTVTKDEKPKISFSQLRLLNLVAALLLAVQGVLVLVLNDPQKGVQPITTNFLAHDPVASSAGGSTVLSAATHHLFDLNIAYLVAAFFFVSALAHLISATWKRKVYEKDLNRGINRSRWVEYAVSASIMMVAIALLVGVFDFTSLIMIFALAAIMSLLGLSMELRNQDTKKVDWANYTIGVATGLMPWIVLLIYIWSAHVYGSGVPGYVYWIYGSLLILSASFAINMYFQYKKLGHWSTYLYGERVYIILGFIAKTALAWQIFAGTLR
jgi:hypothetical protein